MKYSKLEAPPVAINLITSLRSMGYTLSTSVADLVDNSISAGATRIELQFDWDEGKASFMLQDNGCGMDGDMLLKAMTFSSSHVSIERAENDLGRFGLGLKSASLAQCRVLKVFSKCESGQVVGLVWDLNEMEKLSDGKWILIKPENDYIKKYSKKIKDKGTLVIWDDMDSFYKIGVGEKDLLDQIDLVESYLSKTFHRYLDENLTILINNKIVNPNDPINYIKPTYVSPTENIGYFNKPVKLKAYAYPNEINNRNHTKGNYLIYRSSRLLCQGKISDIVKLPVEKHINLVIDIGNAVDLEWDIDIVKSKSVIPKKYLVEIRRFISWVDRKLAKPNKKSNKKIKDSELWCLDDSQKRLIINRGNTHIKNIKRNLNKDILQEFNFLLNEMEKTVPVKIEYKYSDRNEDVDLVSDSNEVSFEVEKEIKLQLLRLIKIKKKSKKQAVEKLKRNELFKRYSRSIDNVATRLDNSDV